MVAIIYETWEQGGIVLIPIALVGFWGFYLIMTTYFELGTGLRKGNLNPVIDKLQSLLSNQEIEAARLLIKTTPELVGYGLSLALEHRALPENALRHLLSERLGMALYKLQRHLPLIRVMAGAAPLLGLLGTVSGLVHTFQVMTEFGSGNSALLSQGISEALIATQTGLLLAITLILLGQRLEGRVHWLQNQVEYGLTVMLNQIYHPKEGGT